MTFDEMWALQCFERDAAEEAFKRGEEFIGYREIRAIEEFFGVTFE